MIVYLLTGEAYHEGSDLVGIYGSLEAAQAAKPGDWEEANLENKGGCKPVTRREVVQGEVTNSAEVYCIYRMEVENLKDVAGKDPIKEFGLAVVEGDPVAIDAVQDVLAGRTQ